MNIITNEVSYCSECSFFWSYDECYGNSEFVGSATKSKSIETDYFGYPFGLMPIDDEFDQNTQIHEDCPWRKDPETAIRLVLT